MMTKQPDLIQGQGAHRRTERDYMGILLDTVTLEDWRDVVRNATAAAKAGDAGARAWLGAFLMGKAEHTAPSPLTVVVEQWSGNDPLVAKLAQPLITRAQYPHLDQQDAAKDHIRDLVAAELRDKLPVPEAPPALAWAGDPATA